MHLGNFKLQRHSLHLKAWPLLGRHVCIAGKLPALYALQIAKYAYVRLEAGLPCIIE